MVKHISVKQIHTTALSCEPLLERTANGELLCVCQCGGVREPDPKNRVFAFHSKDDGETWDTDNVLVDDGTDGDLGYPASVILPNGNILTIFYFKRPDNTCIIRQVIWNYSEE